MNMKEIKKYNKKNVLVELKNGFTAGDLEVRGNEIDIYYVTGFGNGAYSYMAHPLKARDIKNIRVN